MERSCPSACLTSKTIQIISMKFSTSYLGYKSYGIFHADPRLSIIVTSLNIANPVPVLN
jgi:hypothetical protein